MLVSRNTGSSFFPDFNSVALFSLQTPIYAFKVDIDVVFCYRGPFAHICKWSLPGLLKSLYELCPVKPFFSDLSHQKGVSVHRAASLWMLSFSAHFNLCGCCGENPGDELLKRKKRVSHNEAPTCISWI